MNFNDYYNDIPTRDFTLNTVNDTINNTIYTKVVDVRYSNYCVYHYWKCVIY
jgi:hypothetical protein